MKHHCFTPAFANSAHQRLETKQNGGPFLNASTHRLPPEFRDYYRVTGINVSMKTSQSSHLTISVSFNKHIRNVFYCKHLDGFSENIENCCLLCPPYWKQTDSVSLGRKHFKTKWNVLRLKSMKLSDGQGFLPVSQVHGPCCYGTVDAVSHMRNTTGILRWANWREQPWRWTLEL